MEPLVEKGRAEETKEEYSEIKEESSGGKDDTKSSRTDN